MSGVLGAIGTVGGGFLAHRLEKKDKRWVVWICGLAPIIALPFALVSFSSTTLSTALIFMVMPSLLTSVYLGPTGGIIMSLTPTHMRAMVAALNLFLSNFIGLGLGPQLVGILSDSFASSAGDDSLRYGLMILYCFTIAAGAFYFLSSRYLIDAIKTDPSPDFEKNPDAAPVSSALTDR